MRHPSPKLSGSAGSFDAASAATISADLFSGAGGVCATMSAPPDAGEIVVVAAAASVESLRL